jgi:tRNA/rRNA methyltransferase
MRAATIGRFYPSGPRSGSVHILALPYFVNHCMQTRFILINTSHAGNVGAAARAMKTMGFDDLVLVAPRWANVLNREETIQRASGALDVLKNARIVATLDEALDGMTHLCATAMTPRDFGPPTRTPREHFELLLNKKHTAHDSIGIEGDLVINSDASLPPADGMAQPQGMAFLFGCERFGMSNEDVYRCHVALSIPSNPQFASLNLAAALQLVAYEWRLALGGFVAPLSDSLPAGQGSAGDSSTPSGVQADAQQLAGMLAHWERSLISIGFLDPQAPKKLMPRLNQLFNRAGVTQEEIHILRGIAKMMDKAADTQKSPAAAVSPSKD